MSIAAAQCGVVGRTQMMDLGIDRRTLQRARASGMLVDVTSKSYRFASSTESFAARCWALQLHTGERGFLSGTTAARLWGLRRMNSLTVQLTLPNTTRLRLPPWAEVHYTSWYTPRGDRVRRDDGLLVASPMRMLFGLAADLNEFRFRRAAEDAWHLQLIDPADAADYLEAHRCRGKDGVAAFERWLEQTDVGGRPAQSYLERDLLEALTAVGLPPAVRQFGVVLPSGELVHLDIAWPDIKLAVEPGASWWHGGDLGQRRDQARDRALARVGWHVLRFDEELRNDIVAAAREVRAIHRRRSSDIIRPKS